MTVPSNSLPAHEVWQKYDAVEARLTAAVSERMLELAGLSPGMRVLDLACGRGEPGLRAARRVGPLGSVLGVDVSDPVLELARQRALREGISNIQFQVTDAQELDGVPAETFDAATARWGLMYMPSPESALRNTRRALKRDGVLVAAFWAEVERCPWVMLSRQALAPYREAPVVDPEAPGPFRYADPARITGDFADAGFSTETIEEMDIPVIEVETGAGFVEWVTDFGLLPVANELPEAQYLAWQEDLARAAESFRVGKTIRVGGVTRLVVGRPRHRR